MLIMKTSLSKGNKNVESVLKATKHEKARTYDKIVAMMLDTCIGAINDSTVDKIMNTEDPNYWEDSFNDLLDFNKSVFQIIGPELQNTPSEKKILDEISAVVKKPDIYVPFEEEKVDYLTEKFGIYKYSLMGSLSGLVFFLIFVYFYNIVKNN